MFRVELDIQTSQPLAFNFLYILYFFVSQCLRVFSLKNAADKKLMLGVCFVASILVIRYDIMSRFTNSF